MDQLGRYAWRAYFFVPTVAEVRKLATTPCKN